MAAKQSGCHPSEPDHITRGWMAMVEEEDRFVKPYQPKLGNALISSF
jgi:hypothetical protein